MPLRPFEKKKKKPICKDAPDRLSFLLGSDWRALEWGERKNIQDKLRRIQISGSGVDQLRILVYGPVGAGKSSFINSIDSIFQERITDVAEVDPIDTRRCTKTFQTHYIRDQSSGSLLPFALCDVMGLEAGHYEGVKTDDLIQVFQGHIKDGYTFNPTSPCSDNDPGYNRSPRLSDKIHCLVNVLSANMISLIDDPVIDKLKSVRDKARSLGIPQVTILTKVDETCPEVAKDLKLIYRSKRVRKKIQDCSNRLEVPMNCIFPVKCYHEEIQLNNVVDVLLLSALSFILNAANGHVAEMAAAPLTPPLVITLNSFGAEESYI